MNSNLEEEFESDKETVFSLISQIDDMNQDALWELLNQLPVTKFNEPLRKIVTSYRESTEEDWMGDWNN